MTGARRNRVAALPKLTTKNLSIPWLPEMINQERQVSLREAVRGNEKILCWTFFFSLSAIGWRFDAQVSGAIISVPAFRRDFGYLFKHSYVIPADWQSAFNIITAVGQFFGGFSFGWLADKIGRRASLGTGTLICCEASPVSLRGITTAGINLRIVTRQLLPMLP
ncbi:hypothetical protein B0O99DRAFT_690831 [Bisporella sp. PMI_857]|nr:hypothetical protein B0O99DRAFT_690831 [Bisporella sp. PMI_857]